jgi:hypothetical protein
MDIYAAIEAKYGFAIPALYRRMEKDGFFAFEPGRVGVDPWNDSYLWVPEMEWMPLQEILDFEPPSYQRPGFLPFAFTGGGEYWCWWPAEDPEAVVHLPIGDAGVFDAPNILGSIYRRFLDYAIEVSEPNDEEARRYFTLWASRLGEYFPPLWIATLHQLSRAEPVMRPLGRTTIRGLINPARRDELIARDLAFPRLGEDFEWTTD